MAWIEKVLGAVIGRRWFWYIANALIYAGLINYGWQALALGFLLIVTNGMIEIWDPPEPVRKDKEELVWLRRYFAASWPYAKPHLEEIRQKAGLPPQAGQLEHPPQ